MLSVVRPIEELLDPEASAMATLGETFTKAGERAEVLAGDLAKGRESLLALQVTTRSPMGALAYQTGGILIDDGWIRVLGSRCDRLPRGLVDWNRLGAEERLPGALLVGDDVLGGFFAINAGRFPGPTGNVFYFAPDTLDWEDLETGYSGWITWTLEGDLEQFYDSMRWPTWREDTRELARDHAYSIYPFPHIAGPAIAARSRRTVPLEELWQLYVVDPPNQ